MVCGASPVARDCRGNTALHLACRKGDEKAVEILTKAVTTAEIVNARLCYQPLYHHGFVAADLTNYEGKLKLISFISFTK